MTRLVDMTGQRFGRLLVVEYAGTSRWLCRCDCGNMTTPNALHLRRGVTRSCGCLKHELLPERRKTYLWKRERNSYSQMMAHCYNPANRSFARYGARGIVVCDRWRFGDAEMSGPQCFFADMGRCPTSKTLDRIDNNGNYEPGNCRWATPTQQTRNRYLTIEVGSENLAALADRYGFRYATLFSRYERGDRGADLVRPLRQGHGPRTHVCGVKI